MWRAVVLAAVLMAGCAEAESSKRKAPRCLGQGGQAVTAEQLERCASVRRDCGAGPAEGTAVITDEDGAWILVVGREPLFVPSSTSSYGTTMALCR